MNMESIFNFADTLVSKSEAEDHTRRGWLVACDAEKQRGEPPARLEDCVSMQAYEQIRKKQQATQRMWGMPGR